MHSVFFNDKGVLRSGWRASIYVLAFAFVSFLLVSIGQALLLTSGSASGSNLHLFVNALLSLISASFVAWLCLRCLEKLPFRSLGATMSNGWMKHLWIGIGLGGITLAIAVFIAYVFGGLQFELNSGSTPVDIVYSLVVSLLVFGLAAAFEEILFRGYVLQTFSRAGIAWVAIAVTSAFFGLVHMGNPNSDWISTLNTILAGIWFSIAYLKTRDLWFVWGLHLMWNWTQGSIFGIEVSGITQVTAYPLFKEIDAGPTWLTGQDYGIEGGLACTVAIILSCFLIYVMPAVKPDPELLSLTSPDVTGETRSIPS